MWAYEHDLRTCREPSHHISSGERSNSLCFILFHNKKKYRKNSARWKVSTIIRNTISMIEWSWVAHISDDHLAAESANFDEYWPHFLKVYRKSQHKFIYGSPIDIDCMMFIHSEKHVRRQMWLKNEMKKKHYIYMYVSWIFFGKCDRNKRRRGKKDVVFVENQMKNGMK